MVEPVVVGLLAAAGVNLGTPKASVAGKGRRRRRRRAGCRGSSDRCMIVDGSGTNRQRVPPSAPLFTFVGAQGLAKEEQVDRERRRGMMTASPPLVPVRRISCRTKQPNWFKSAFHPTAFLTRWLVWAGSRTPVTVSDHLLPTSSRTHTTLQGYLSWHSFLYGSQSHGSTMAANGENVCMYCW